MDEIGQVVEGFYNTKETYLLAQRQGVEMPITEQILPKCSFVVKVHRGRTKLIGS